MPLYKIQIIIFGHFFNTLYAINILSLAVYIAHKNSQERRLAIPKIQAPLCTPASEWHRNDWCHDPAPDGPIPAPAAVDRPPILLLSDIGERVRAPPCCGPASAVALDARSGSGGGVSPAASSILSFIEQSERERAAFFCSAFPSAAAEANAAIIIPTPAGPHWLAVRALRIALVHQRIGADIERP